jgi:tryptophan synthase alpha chain
MTYVNPVLALGWRRFAGACADAGVAGVIIPDLPPEEAGPWRRAAAGAGLEPVFMAAPTTPPARVAEIARQGGGFLYYVSMTGVTGGQLRLDGAARRRLAGARRASGLPVAVGFGVARPEQARELAGLADGVVVGSALLRAHARGGMAGFAGLARGLRASLAR